MFGANPKDGWKAICVAVCASILQAVVLGINNSFPNFISQMLADEDLNTTSSMLSLVQAVGLGLAGCMALPAGIVVAKFGSRISSLIASVSLIICMVVTSVGANSGESMIGLYSVFMAIAVAFMMSPGATATSSWFDKRAALGMGICFTGGGTGSLAIPRIAGALTKQFSWRTSFLILAALAALGVLASFFICVRPEDEEENDLRAVGDISPADGGAADAGSVAATPANEQAPDSPVVAEGHAAASGAVMNHGNNNMHSISDAGDANNDIKAGPNNAVATTRRFNYHTDKATVKQLFFECLMTRSFIGLFSAYATFSFGFYAMLYIAVPYPQSMGTGPYADAEPISVDSASNVFVPFGIMETIGGPFLGWVAVRTDERLVFIASMGMMSVAAAFYALCRKLWEHIVLYIIFGTGASAFFATFGTMIAQRYWGPNLSVIMSSGFTGCAVGGFLGSTVATAISDSQGGDYTYVTVLMSLAFFLSGLCVMFIVQDVADADAHLAEPVSNTTKGADVISPLLCSLTVEGGVPNNSAAAAHHANGVPTSSSPYSSRQNQQHMDGPTPSPGAQSPSPGNGADTY